MAEPQGQATTTAQDPQEAIFERVFGEAVRTVEDRGIPYVLIGGLASAAWGRPRWTHDIDFFVYPDDAHKALTALANAGFATERTKETWLFKAFKESVLVDLIFKVTGDIYLDEEMLARGRRRELKGQEVTLVAPEDLVVIKSLVHDEDNPRHWHDVLAILASTELDWDYLIKRARNGARRVLSLLLYAQSNDLPIPDEEIERLFKTIYGGSNHG